MELGLGSSGGGGSGSRQSKEVSQKTIYIYIYTYIYIYIIIYYRLREGPKKNVKMCIYIYIYGLRVGQFVFFLRGDRPSLGPYIKYIYIYVHIVFSFPRINNFLSMHSEALDFPRRNIINQVYSLFKKQTIPF